MSEFYNKPENVIFINPIVRFLAKLVGAKYFVTRCEVCNRIPTELYGNKCKKHCNL